MSRAIGSPAAMALIGVLILFGAFLVIRGAADAGPSAASGSTPGVAELPARSGQYVVVGPGDTLRSLALEHAPDADPTRLVDGIQALNGGERTVEVGQVLALPRLDP